MRRLPRGSPSPAGRRRITVCHVIFRLDVGGLENGLVNLVNLLPTDRYSHTILSLEPATAFKYRIEHDNTRVLDVNKRPGVDPGVYGKVWRMLRQIDPQIVHTRNLPALDLLMPAYFSGRRALIHGEHGLGTLELDGKNKKYNRLRRLSRLVADRYIVVSRDLQVWLNREIGVPQSKITLIYNGVDTERFSPKLNRATVLPAGFAAEGSFVVGSVGRLSPIKNYVNLVNAFCSLLESDQALRDRLRLVIVGDGPSRAECERVLEDAQVRDLAWLPGMRDDIDAVYRALDLFVLPSGREGISNTLLEAMASGVAVVATRVGGTPEIVPDGVVGKLVPSGDVDALAAAIRRYSDDRSRCRAHGDAARRHVLANFSLQAMVDRYDEVYQSV